MSGTLEANRPGMISVTTFELPLSVSLLKTKPNEPSSSKTKSISYKQSAAILSTRICGDVNERGGFLAPAKHHRAGMQQSLPTTGQKL